MSDVLVLNRHYYAVHISPWQRAMTLLYRGHAHVLDEEMNRYNFEDWKTMSEMMESSPSGFVHATNFKIAVPEVIALSFYDELPDSDVKFTRKNLYHHYGNKCCYCGKKFGTAELNLDHVMPKSRGGLTDWNNIVLSCIPCNITKADRTPREAGMKPHYNPSRPTWKPTYTIGLRAGFQVKESWQKFVDKLYWNVELERK